MFDYWKSQLHNIKGGYLPSGGTEDMLNSSVRLILELKRFVAFDGRSILDVGCGNGRIPIGLSLFDISILRYMGLDVIPESILFCRDAFENIPEYVFKQLHVKNGRYKNQNNLAESEVRFSLTNRFDLIICYGLFPYMDTLYGVQNYINEIAAACLPNAVFLSTWIFSPDNDGARRRSFFRSEIDQIISRNFEITQSTEPIPTLANQNIVLAIRR